VTRIKKNTKLWVKGWGGERGRELSKETVEPSCGRFVRDQKAKNEGRTVKMEMENAALEGKEARDEVSF